MSVGAADEQDIEESIPATGTVGYDQNRLAQLSVRVPGTAWMVCKQVGQPVRKGELLAVVDAAEVGRAKAELLKSLVDRDVRKGTFERLSRASASVPERTIREAEADFREAKVRVFNAQQSLANLGLPISLDEVDGLSDEMRLKRLRFLGLPQSVVDDLHPEVSTANLIPLLAPFDGLVIAREVVVGEVVSPGHAHFTVADVSRIWVTFSIRRENAGRLAVGQEVRFRADGVAGELVSRISWISTEVDEKTRTVKARAEFDNTAMPGASIESAGPDLLRANMFGTANIKVSTRANAVVVPNEAVQWLGNAQMVFISRDGGRRFEPRRVTTGISRGALTEIVDGLLPGEPVVTAGSFMLKSELLRRHE